MTQVNPVDSHPNADTLLVGALLWAAPAAAANVLEHVGHGDVESVALGEVLGAIASLNREGKQHGPQLVLDELRRTGRVRRHNGVAGELQRATTSGADPIALQQYACAVVAGAMRRRIESVGVAMQTAALEAPENDMLEHFRRGVRFVEDCVLRLHHLRGGVA